jgi:hypothetical protein
MLHELSRYYPDMVVEMLETPEHSFNLFNRDQSTPLLKPDKWNADTLVIDTWNKNIYNCLKTMSFNLPDKLD